jgi:hypothetical protein
MKITIDIGSDEELRKEILHMVSVQIKKTTGEEIKKMAQDYLSQVNVAAKITSAIKDTLNKQIDFMIRGYGDMAIKQELEKKFSTWIEKNFNTYFDDKVKGYIKNYIEDKTTSFQDFLNTIKKLK